MIPNSQSNKENDRSNQAADHLHTEQHNDFSQLVCVSSSSISGFKTYHLGRRRQPEADKQKVKSSLAMYLNCCSSFCATPASTAELTGEATSNGLPDILLRKN